MLVVGEGAGHNDGDEECLGKEPSQLLSVQASGGRLLQELSMSKEASDGHPLQELSTSKETSGGRPLQELSMSKETSGGRPLQELSMSKETSGGRPLQEVWMSKEMSGGRPLQLLLNQETTPWMNPAQIPQIERSPSRPESQQRLAGQQIKFLHF